MKKFVISGGNSGIGLEAARQLTALGHHVILLGRDPAKGEAATAALRNSPGRSEFHAVDLSTHAGVRAAADKLLGLHPVLDGALMGAGVLRMSDFRTDDDLNAVFATNYLSRYHLTQRLLPALKQTSGARVVLLVAGVPLTTRIDFNVFPQYKPFPGMRALSGIQIANFHYVAHLAKAEPGLAVALTNVGLVDTPIMRAMPGYMKFMFKLFAPLATIPVSRAAANAVQLLTQEGWPSGAYWAKPGKFDQVTPLALDTAETQRVVAASHQLTGA